MITNKTRSAIGTTRKTSGGLSLHFLGVYPEYCRENSEYEFSHRRFSQKLIEREFTRSRQSKRYWNGIRLMSLVLR